MIVHEKLVQGSIEWLVARAGIPTASEFHHLVTPKKLEIRTGREMDSYVCRKLAEKWSGPLMGFNSFSTDQGEILEGEALGWFEFEYEPIRKVGFITDDAALIGCSPDGLLSIGGIEFKCPQPEAHVRYLLAGTVPEQYVMQVQGCMLVTGAEVWKFVSYRRSYPPLVLNVQRDEKIQEALTEALQYFRQKFVSGWVQLCEKNDGPPPPRETLVNQEPKDNYDRESVSV